MRRFLALVFLLCLAIPAGVSISGCVRNPAGNYCNGAGYGLKLTDVDAVSLQPTEGGISLAYGQTRQASTPDATTCMGGGAVVSSTLYTYGTTNNQLVDISPSGNICAGTWNRNTGGGIANYTICNFPSPLPSSGGLPYGVAYITASIQSVTSNPVAVYVHQQVTSISLVGPTQCLSQNALAQLDAQACFQGSNNTQQLLCAPAGTTVPACPLPAGQTLASIPSCESSIGTLSFAVASGTIASINSLTNQITALQPGTTAITASIAGSGSSAGYFTTCPPESINVTLANGSTSGTITQGVQQNLTTTVLDTNGNTITGLALDYQSTDPIDISVSGGSISSIFPGTASVYAICQPATCNPSPINQVGLNGTGLSVASNPVIITTPGTASDFVWFGAPGQSQYFVPIELLSGTAGSTVRLPYVPNSMVMDRLGENLYFGSAHELMVYNTVTNALSKQDTSAPGVVLAVAPNNSLLLINDQARQVFYLYNSAAGTFTTFGGLGNAASWTPDAKTLYVTDNASLNNPAEGITGHTDTLYVYNQAYGWSTYPLPPSPLPAGSLPSLPPNSLPWTSLPANVAVSNTIQTPALTIPSVGAYLRGVPTDAHTWCPTGIVGNNATLTYYPVGDSVNAQTDTLTSTTDGTHILGAAMIGGGITLSDIAVKIPTSVTTPSGDCIVTGSAPNQTLSPLTIPHTLTEQPLVGVNATAVNQVIASPQSNLAFITYTGSTPGAPLPYYVPGAGSNPGTVQYITLNGSSAVTAPLAGAFSPDNSYFFVSTAGDNMIHYISVPTLKDTQQIAPNLPSCVPLSAGGNDVGCTYSGSGTVVPATVITVKPRSTT